MINHQDIAKLKVTTAADGQTFLVGSVLKGADSFETSYSLYERVAKVLLENRLEIIHERIWGSLKDEYIIKRGRNSALNVHRITPYSSPITYIQGRPVFGDGMAGMIIHAVPTEGAFEKVFTLNGNGTPYGRGFIKRGTKYLVLQNIQGLVNNAGAKNSKTTQTSKTIERAYNILNKQGADFSNVIRTWFYLSNILDWYDKFNQVRNARYDEFGIMPGNRKELLLPASTGIEGDVSNGASCTIDLMAVIGLKDCSVKMLRNSAQKEAFDYGSAFSRAAVIRDQDTTIIKVSGTAAIDEKGNSLYLKDSAAQISCTLDKVEALINQYGLSLKDIAAATVFLKRPEDADIFQKAASDRGISEFKEVCVVANICRDELLFELDAEVVRSKQ